MARRPSETDDLKKSAQANSMPALDVAKRRALKMPDNIADQPEHSDNAVPHGYAAAPASAQSVKGADVPEPEFGIGDTLKLVRAEVVNLFQAEKDLIVAKGSLAVRAAKSAIIWIAVAGLAIVAASLAALYAFIALLTPWLGAAGAAGLVAVIWLAICGFGVYRARNVIVKAIAQIKD